MDTTADEKYVPGLANITIHQDDVEAVPGAASSAVTFEDVLGFTVPRKTTKSIFGRSRTWESICLKEWIFLLVSVISIIASAGFVIYRLITLPPGSEDDVFALLVLINLAFSVWYLFHGVFQEAPFEICVLVLTTVIILCYVILNYIMSTDDEVKLVRLIISCILGPVTAIFGCVVAYDYFDSGNLVFRTVGADMQLQSQCRILFLGLTLMTFDAQAMAGCIVLVMDDGFLHMSLAETLILIFGVVLVTLWMVFGYFAVRLESMVLTVVFFVLSLTQPAYVIWKFTQRPDPEEKSMLDVAIFLLGTLFFVIYIALIIVFVKIASNYGKGLNEKVFDTPPIASRVRSYGTLENEEETE